jgi:nicotinamidase-related amidase
MSDALTRSPELLASENSLLLVVDVQEKLLPTIAGGPRLVWNIQRLIKAATALSVPVITSEQYPKGLGPTVSELRDTSPVFEKRAFSCGSCEELQRHVQESGRFQLVVVGMETHVCILQTVLDLLAQGYRVHVPADAVAARGTLDHDVALRRIEAAGGTITTTEGAMFEWCHTSDRPEFKFISSLIREVPPT